MAVKTEPYLIQELFSPRVEASEGLFVRDVEHQKIESALAPQYPKSGERNSQAHVPNFKDQGKEA